MARKISQATLDRLREENEVTVVVKRRPEPQQKEEVQQQEEIPDRQALLTRLVSMIVLSQEDIVNAIQENQPIPQRPIRDVKVSHIERNGQNRIESAQFTTTYKDD